MSTSANHAYAARSLASTGLIMTGASNKRSKSDEEGRLLGDFTSPDDATPIADPLKQQIHTPIAVARSKPGSAGAFKHQNTLATPLGRGRGQPGSSHSARTYGKGQNHAEYGNIVQDLRPNKRQKVDKDVHPAFPVHHRSPYELTENYSPRPISSLIDDDVQEISSLRYHESPANRHQRRTVQVRLQDGAVSGSGEYRKTEERMSAKTQSMPQDDFIIQGASLTNPAIQRQNGQVVIRKSTRNTIDSDSDSELVESHRRQYQLITNQRNHRPARSKGDSSTKDISSVNEPSGGISIKGMSERRNDEATRIAVHPKSRDQRSSTAQSDGSGNSTDELQQDTPERQSPIVARHRNSRNVERHTSGLTTLGDDIPSSEMRSNSPSKRTQSLRKLSPVAKIDGNKKNLQFFRIHGQAWTEPELSISLNKEEKVFEITKVVSSGSGLNTYRIEGGRVNQLLYSQEHTAVRLMGPRNTKISRNYYFHLGFETLREVIWFRDQVNHLWPNGVRTKAIPEHAMENYIANPPEDQPRLDPVDVDMEEMLLSSRVKTRQGQQQRFDNVQPAVPNGEKRKHELLPPKKTSDQSLPVASNEEKRPTQISDMIAEPIDRPGRRVTRQMNRSDYDVEPSNGPVNYVPFDVGPKWNNAVVFGTAKKRAIVDYEDLHRLNDSELLNDNLIEFYLNWLQEKNPTEEHQVHFFSTHFYSALTAQRGRINHKAVERWTKQVDIFSYDFVVVPVNEAYHWYLALICNLPNLRRELDAAESALSPNNESSAIIDITSSTESLQNNSKAEDTLAAKVKAILGSKERNDNDLKPVNDAGISPSLEAQIERIVIDNDDKVDSLSQNPKDQTHGQQESVQEIQLVVQEVPPTGRSTPASTRRGKSRPGPPPKKYPASQPTIVIIDSMSTTHPNTIRNLKDYLIAEARAKRGMDIEKEEFQGVNAKRGIPTQGNFADCGLFLCGYIEKFLKDPRTFVTKLLRQEFSLDDWGWLNAARMRGEIRGLLMKLYEDQEAERVRLKAEKKAIKKADRITTNETTAESKTPAATIVNIPEIPPPQPQSKEDPMLEDEVDHEKKDRLVEASLKYPVPAPAVEANQDDVIVPSTPKLPVRDFSELHLDHASPANRVPDQTNTNETLSSQSISKAEKDGDPAETTVRQLRHSASKFFDISSTALVPETDESQPLQPMKMITGILSNLVTVMSPNSNHGDSLKRVVLSEKAQAAAEFSPRDGVQYRVEIPETPPHEEADEIKMHESSPSLPDSDEEVKLALSSTSPESPQVDRSEVRRSTRSTSSNKKSGKNNRRSARDRSASPLQDTTGRLKYRNRR